MKKPETYKYSRLATTGVEGEARFLHSSPLASHAAQVYPAQRGLPVLFRNLSTPMGTAGL